MGHGRTLNCFAPVKIAAVAEPVELLPEGLSIPAQNVGDSESPATAEGIGKEHSSRHAHYTDFFLLKASIRVDYTQTGRLLVPLIVYYTLYEIGRL